jgi:hypothetical protein
MDVLTLSTATVAGATVIYATLTYLLLREQRREKEKPRIQEIATVVIYPLMEKLENQKNFFKKGDFSWTRTGFYYYRQKIAPSPGIEGLIYEDFRKAFPDIVKNIEKYNKVLEKQKEILDNFANKIRSLPDFIKEVSKRFMEYERESKLADILGVCGLSSLFESNTQNIEHILAYVVNNEQNLNSDNAYYNFWNQYGKELLKFRDREEVKDYKVEVEKECKNLLGLADSIFKDLKDILKDYREKYGIIYKELEREW